MSLIRIGRKVFDPAEVLGAIYFPADGDRAEGVEVTFKNPTGGWGFRLWFQGEEFLLAKAWLESVPEFTAPSQTSGSVPAQCYQNPGPGYFAHTTKLPERAKELLAELEMTERAKDTRPEPLL